MTSVNEVFERGTFVGRVWRPEVAGPALVVLRGGDLFDITSKEVPAMRDLLELDDPVGFLSGRQGERLFTLEAVMAASVEATGDLSGVGRQRLWMISGGSRRERRTADRTPLM
ncbi:hypothetical protein LP421_19035 [Rhizobium sp. RCAM05350]|nr:hypothetical protein LP421_19035 [Rhizobium sp. RCAM05350]